ncbi:MAG: hypothetical protein ACRD3O_09435 [Terriglobia bacterium]
MESRLIDTLKECDVTGVTRLTGTSWDEAWGGDLSFECFAFKRKDT